MLYFQYVLNVNWQIIYLLGSNYGTVRGMIFLGMTAPMTFQTVFDVLDYVLVIHAILGNYAVNIFDQAHIIPKYLFGSSIGRIKAILFVRIDHDLKMRKKKREVWLEVSSPTNVWRNKEMAWVSTCSIFQDTSIIEGVVLDSISKNTFNVLERAFGRNLWENMKCPPSQKYYKWWKQRKGYKNLYWNIPQHIWYPQGESWIRASCFMEYYESIILLFLWL